MAEEKNSIATVVKSLMDGAESVLTSKTVVGAPVRIGDQIIIPLSDVSIGCGAGSNGTDHKDAGAGGFSAKMTPTAILIIKNGQTKVVNIKDQTAVTKLVDMIPDVVDKIKGRNSDMISDDEAGGTGQRMNTKTRPKQFLELHGKPIIVYTLEAFDQHSEIDGIIVVMLESWIGYTQELVRKFGLKKIRKIVPGGSTGQESIYNGLCAAAEFYGEKDIVLIHDGVRPLIDEETISDNIRTVKEKGTAITVTAAIETITMKDETGAVGTIIDRSMCELARAPQSFYLGEILGVHNRVREEHGGTGFIDSASMMKHYGYKLYTVQGKPENIKITTPSDFYIFRAMVDARESSQIFGI